MVFFSMKEEMDDPSRDTKVNPVTLGSTQSSLERWDDSSRGYDRSATPSGSLPFTESSMEGNV